MGAGGVIIVSDAEALMGALNKLYNRLGASDKDKFELVRMKPVLERTQEDVNFMLDKLNELCRG